VLRRRTGPSKRSCIPNPPEELSTLASSKLAGLLGETPKGVTAGEAGTAGGAGAWEGGRGPSGSAARGLRATRLRGTRSSPARPASDPTSRSAALRLARKKKRPQPTRRPFTTNR
jgi:hypothetical protein